MNSNLDSFLQFLLIYQDYSEQIQAFHEDEVGALKTINEYIKQFGKIDKKALSSDDNYWAIVIQQMIDGNL